MHAEEPADAKNEISEEPAEGGIAAELFGLAHERLSALARNFPAFSFAGRQVRRVERAVLLQLKRRLEDVDSAPPRSVVRVAGRAVAESARGAAGILLGDLLERSMTQTKAEARAELHRHVLAQLLPDEARILSALSDGSTYPLVHVGVGPPVGPLVNRVQDNVSNVGRAAGVLLLDQVPAYIGHLRLLGLAQTGPEDKTLKTKYEIVESDDLVRGARETIEKSKRSARILRRTLLISPLGRELWQACFGGEDAQAQAIE